MAQKIYGVAVLGAGHIAPTHCRAVQQIPHARLVACCDRDLARAEKLAADFDIPHVYEDLHELLRREDVDVVEILTWSGVHAEQGMAAALAGKHVLITKPIDTRLERIDMLIRTCREQGVKLGATHQFRSYPSYRRLKEAIDAGRLGRLFLGSAYVKWWRGQDYYDSAAWRGTWNLDGGGVLMNQGVHYVDLLTWLLGPPTSLRGYLATQCHDIEVEDCATAALHFRNGALGTLQASTCTYRGFPARLEVHGERGNVIIEGDAVTLWDVEGDPVERGVPGDGSSTAPASGLKELQVSAHVEQISDFLAAVEENREPLINGEEARRAVEVVLAVYHSAWSGETVHFPLEHDPLPPAIL